MRFIARFAVCTSFAAMAAALAGCGAPTVFVDMDIEGGSQPHSSPTPVAVTCLGGVDDDGDGEWDRMDSRHVFTALSTSACRQQGGAVSGGIALPSVARVAQAVTTPGPESTPPPDECSGYPDGGCLPEGEHDDETTDDVESTGIDEQEYDEDYDCDDFAGDLEWWLTYMGYDATFTIIYYDNNGDGDICDPPVDTGHAITDVHSADGSVVWYEPQTGKPYPLDQDGDGEVGTGGWDDDDPCATTEGNTRIEVYDSREQAEAVNGPI